MEELGVDVLLLSVGADLPYFTGYSAMPLERLTMLVLPRDGAATLVVPRLEAPRVEERPEAFTLRPWGETEDPVAIVASGPNAASPHHEPGERVVEVGDSVVCDFGGAMAGYCSDITRTFVVGEPPADLVDLYEVLFRAQEEAVRAARVGVSCEAVDAAARTVIAAAGYGDYFIHRTGHGIGLEEHEDPYLVSGNATPLAAGHAFSIEPLKTLTIPVGHSRAATSTTHRPATHRLSSPSGPRPSPGCTRYQWPRSMASVTTPRKAAPHTSRAKPRTNGPPPATAAPASPASPAAGASRSAPGGNSATASS